jgi:hypothetical protein
MTFMRSTRWILLALAIFGVAAQQQARAQLAPGTARTGTFIWDGQRWIPADQYQPPAPVFVEEDITADAPPPPLPVYDQPPCPEPNLMWMPGNWHWGPGGYYWVPGAWVPAPYTGALWTPGYWGWVGGRYSFHTGYWGPHIGFYGGVNFGGGYMGIGFAGGAWNGGVFAYNTAVVHVNVNVVTNVYINRTIVEQTTIVNDSHTSFNGGPNGVQHQPTPDEQIAAHETHQPPTSFQQQHVAAAKSDPSSFAKNNGGHPAKLAETKPLPEEKHAAPAGFKPPPARPVTELAKAQAPASTIAAAKTATAKTATAKPAAPAPAAPKTATTAPTKTAGRPAPAGAVKPPEKEAGAETTAPKTAEKAPEPEHKPATAPAGKTAVPAAKPAEKPTAPAKAAPPAKADKSKKPEKEKKPE